MLVALAYQANMTRIFTFMMAAEVSGQTYNRIGVSDAFHPLSHHNNQPAVVKQMSKINRYHTQLFAKYLAKLRATPEFAALVEQARQCQERFLSETK